MRVNPLERIDENFIVADFGYTDSVVRLGLENYLPSSDKHIGNARALADLLSGVYDTFGPLSINYGFISPEVSRRIVKYQSPDKPSHHRWDLGAAADIIVHDWFFPERNTYADWVVRPDACHSPIALAAEIAHAFNFSRMITYSESPSICIAAKEDETVPRRALHENRYMGAPKPLFISHRKPPTRDAAIASIPEQHGWVGRGYPSYHGGGRLQYHHQRAGRYLTMLDCLHCPHKLEHGIANRPPTRKKHLERFLGVANLLDRFLRDYHKEAGDTRLSIVASHGSQIENMRAHPDWEDDESDFIFPDLPEETGLDWAKHREPTVMLAAQIDQYENVVSEFLRSKPQYRHKVVRVWAYAGSIFFLMKLGA